MKDSQFFCSVFHPSLADIDIDLLIKFNNTTVLVINSSHCENQSIFVVKKNFPQSIFFLEDPIKIEFTEIFLFLFTHFILILRNMMNVSLNLIAFELLHVLLESDLSTIDSDCSSFVGFQVKRI